MTPFLEFNQAVSKISNIWPKAIAWNIFLIFPARMLLSAFVAQVAQTSVIYAAIDKRIERRVSLCGADELIGSSSENKMKNSVISR